MRRYSLVGRREIRLEDSVPVPVPGHDEVLVKVGSCTVCNRSDLVYYHYLGLRDHCGQGCFGHEIAGTVERTGTGAEDLSPGDRVFIRTPLTSGFADYALARRVALGRLPDGVSFEHGSILQLLPLAVHATRGVRLGDRVAILGQGPVGKMALQVALRRGAAEVVVADLDPWRLAGSKALGANRVVEVTGTDDSGYEAVGDDFDVAVDAVGTESTVNACADLVRRGGLVVMLGTHHIDTHVSFDLVKWEKKGLRVHSSAEPTDEARVAAMIVAQRLAATIDLAALYTKSYRLNELPEAIERLSDNNDLYPARQQPMTVGPPQETLKLAIVP
jgi:L-iditol 2-dehydrogenase